MRAVASRATFRSTLPAFRRGGGADQPAERLGDRMLFVVCGLAAALAAAILVGVAYQLITNANPSLSRFGLGFLGHTTWSPNFKIFGAAA